MLGSKELQQCLSLGLQGGVPHAFGGLIHEAAKRHREKSGKGCGVGMGRQVAGMLGTLEAPHQRTVEPLAAGLDGVG